jgi:hypothetical protein
LDLHKAKTETSNISGDGALNLLNEPMKPLHNYLYTTAYKPKLSRRHCNTPSSLALRLLFCCLFLLTNYPPVLGASPNCAVQLSTLHSSKAKIMTQKNNQVNAVRGGSSKQAVDSTHTSWGTRARNVLFPIHGDEVKKFLLIGSIKFFVILALTLTRDNKDTMVVTACGAEAIAFLKVSWFGD